MRMAHRRAVGATLIWILVGPAAGAPFGPAPEPVPEAQPEPLGAEPAPTTPDAPSADAPSADAFDRSDPSSKPIGRPRRADDPFESNTQSTDDTGNADTPAEPMIPGGIGRTLGALGGVLALIFAIAHGVRHLARSRGTLASQLGAGGDAPSGIVEILGRYPLGRGQSLVVLRFGRRVLLLSNAPGSKRSGESRMTTLCELDDADETASILRAVAEARGESSSARFEQTLREVGGATDDTIARALTAQRQAAARQRPGSATRHAPGILSNDEGDRLELTSTLGSQGGGGSLRRRLGALRRGGGA